MKTKHTPGPWEVKHSHLEGMQEIWGPEEIQVGWVITETMNKNVRETDKANAALIAASPDLLSACKKALRVLEGRPVIISEADTVHNLSNVLRNAIGKSNPEE